MLTVEDIDVFYGRIQALRGLSLHVAEGETVALLGPNGAGKSTTVKTITGIMRPRSGRIVLDDRRLDRMSSSEIVKAGVVQVPEGRRVFPGLTVLENLRVGAYTVSDGVALQAGIDRVMATFPRLEERSSLRAGSLSGGEQQMLAIGRALVSRPRLLLIDEMSLGLAPTVVQMLAKFLGELSSEGVTIVLVEQFVKLALGVSDRAYVLEKGSVVLEGESAALRKNEQLLHSSYMGASGNGNGRRAPRRTRTGGARR